MHSSLQTWATEVLPSARATVVSGFAGCLFAGSAVSSALIAGPAGAGHFGAAFLALAVACVPLGLLATVYRAHWRPPAAAPPQAAVAASATHGETPGGSHDECP